MSTLVHLTLENRARKIRRGGIKVQSARIQGIGDTKGIFASPILQNYVVTHQWLRELKRQGGRTIVGVYFKIPDQELVYVGHFGQKHKQMTASEAEGFFRSMDDALGYEVFLPRKVHPKEITSIRNLPQVLGWRYFPKAQNRKPCLCPICRDRGGIKSRKLREKSIEREAEIMQSFAQLIDEAPDRDLDARNQNANIPDPNRPSEAKDWKRYKRQKINEWKLKSE